MGAEALPGGLRQICELSQQPRLGTGHRLPPSPDPAAAMGMLARLASWATRGLRRR